MTMLLTNNAESTLAVAVTSAGQTTLTLKTGDGAKFPSIVNAGDWFPVTLDDSTQIEICKCTARTGDVLTVERGAEGSAAKSSFAANNTKVELRITAWGARAFFVYPFDARATLRTLAPIDGGAVLVDGLGLFTWEPYTGLVLDDGETCFATSSPQGRWCMRAAHPEAAFWICKPSIDAAGLDAAAAFWAGKVLVAQKTNAVTSIGANAYGTFTVTVPGAKLGDMSLCVPPNADASSTITYFSVVTASNTVTIKYSNISAGTVDTYWGTGLWTIVVISKG